MTAVAFGADAVMDAETSDFFALGGYDIACIALGWGGASSLSFCVVKILDVWPGGNDKPAEAGCVRKCGWSLKPQDARINSGQHRLVPVILILIRSIVGIGGSLHPRALGVL